MARTPLFSRLVDTLRLAASDAPAREVVDEAAAAHADAVSRRRMLAGMGGTLAGATVLGCEGGGEPDERIGRREDPIRAVSASIGIVGAGIAGLACAYELKRAKCTATIHEGSSRIGGRIWSMGGSFPGPVMFPGQVVERGGELIDTPHKATLAYAREFGLALEDVAKPKRDTFYFFGGTSIPEATMVEEYRVLVAAMKKDLLQVGSPTAQAFTPADQALDFMSLRQYLESRGAPTHIKNLLNVAYAIEYGVETDQQSCLAFLLFTKASRQSKLRLWGNSSDERYHLTSGNEAIPRAIAAKLPGQIKLGRKLVRAKKTAAGRVELTFVEGAKTVTATHDAVVLAIPFNLLREVELDASLALPAWKKYAIQNSRYGTNAKLMVGFTGQPWVDLGGNGAVYTDLPRLQAAWETNPANADATRGVLTDYAGGNLGVSLDPAKVQLETASFLAAYDRAVPGALAKARRDASGKYVAHLEHWPTSPWTRGSYTANQPGYFTTLADNEGRAVGNLYFAGETTDSFYSWQGFMEGGCLSGHRAAGEIVRDLG